MLPADLVQRLAGKIDPVLRKVTDAFGSTVRVDLDGDGKTAFVFHRFPPETEVLDGYFTSIDLYTPEQLTAADLIEEASYTNAMDVLHLNVLNRKSLEGVGEVRREPRPADDRPRIPAPGELRVDRRLQRNMAQRGVLPSGRGHRRIRLHPENPSSELGRDGQPQRPHSPVRIRRKLRAGRFSGRRRNSGVRARLPVLALSRQPNPRLPGGGDSVYRSVFDAMRDERGWVSARRRA